MRRMWLLLVLLALVAGMAGGWAVRSALAADVRFADADNAIAKAIALLEEATTAGSPERCDRPRVRSIKTLARVRTQIEKAVTCVDANL